MEIPIIDIGPLAQPKCRRTRAELDTCVGQISLACQSYGFFAISNHGACKNVTKNLWESSKAFFDLPLEVKSSTPMTEDYPYGYEMEERLCARRRTHHGSVVDSKETFSIGPLSALSGMPFRRFPVGGPASFETSLNDYYESMEKLAEVLFRGFALALELDENWFTCDGRFDRARHQCALRILNYPHLKFDDSGITIRAGAHTDYGAFTILKSGGPGLQLNLSGDGAKGSWLDVPYLDDDVLIINLGDLMQRWTNDKWRSTLHRVVAESNESERGECESIRRQSIAFFVNMNGDASIETLGSCMNESNKSRYQPIKASDYLIKRHAQSMGQE
mmetsp:Transcript_32926/g.78630  ORF Transcript_32926/g.78630 Transcript_32926/m.78630 type:complete len:332 (+) Transcript_32926:531-1526(+)